MQRIIYGLIKVQKYAEIILKLEYQHKRLVKTKILDVYSSISHIEWYNFYYQCEKYFLIVEVTDLNQVSFAIIFLEN